MAMPPNLLLRIRRIASGVAPDKTRITNHFSPISAFSVPLTKGDEAQSAGGGVFGKGLGVRLLRPTPRPG